MNKIWRMIASAGLKMGSRAKMLWAKVGFKNTAKVAAWASKNKGWLQTVGLTAVSAGTGSLITQLVSSYVGNKEEVAQRWIESTGELTPERASFRKKVSCIGELRDVVNKLSGYGDSGRDDEYLRLMVRMSELTNYLIHNEADEEVRRVAVRASILIPSCLESGQVPEEGFTNVLVLRAMRNLSEDSVSAEDIEGSLDSVLDIAESGCPLKSV